MQKRYLSEEEILQDIARARRRSQLLLLNAGEYERTANHLLAKNDPGSDVAGNDLLKEVKTMRTRAHNLVQTRVPKLTRLLAEFRTQPMPFLPDASVVFH